MSKTPVSIETPDSFEAEIHEVSSDNDDEQKSKVRESNSWEHSLKKSRYNIIKIIKNEIFKIIYIFFLFNFRFNLYFYCICILYFENNFKFYKYINISFAFIIKNVICNIQYILNWFDINIFLLFNCRLIHGRMSRTNAIDTPRTSDSTDVIVDHLDSLENNYIKQEEATASPYSYLSMPSCKAFPSIKNVEPLSRVLEPVMVSKFLYFYFIFIFN